MSRNLSANADLAGKYAVGEVVDMGAVPSFYDAGTSKWMRSATFMAGSTLPESLRNRLATDPNNVALEQTSLLSGSQTVATKLPVAKIGNTSVFSMGVSGNNNNNVLVINPDGARLVNVGFASSQSNIYVEAVGSTFYAIALSGGSFNTKARIRTSSDGLTWTEIAGTWSLSGTVAFGSTQQYGFMSESVYYGVLPVYHNSTTTGGLIAYCGARWLMIGNDGTNMQARLSSDLVTWVDATTTLFGGTGYAHTRYSLFHRNGNSCWHGTANDQWRYTTDGGINWSLSTGIAAFNISSGSPGYVKNSTMPAKFLLVVHSSTDARLTTNNGQTFSTITLPAILNDAIVYRGSTILFRSGNSVFISTNDGASFSSVLFPVGVSGEVTSVMDDGTNFYLSIGASLLISPDGATWTVRNLATTTNSYNMVASGSTRISSNGSTVTYSLDGGVTWRKAMHKQITSGSSAPSVVAVTNGTETFFVLGAGHYSNNGCAVLTQADLALGGAWFRSGSAAITALRGNTTPMIRVA